MSVDGAAIAILWEQNSDIFDGKLDRISLRRPRNISSHVYGDQNTNLKPKHNVFLNLTKHFFPPKLLSAALRAKEN